VTLPRVLSARATGPCLAGPAQDRESPERRLVEGRFRAVFRSFQSVKMRGRRANVNQDRSAPEDGVQARNERSNRAGEGSDLAGQRDRGRLCFRQSGSHGPGNRRHSCLRLARLIKDSAAEVRTRHQKT
jgi:hypothetical protein